MVGRVVSIKMEHTATVLVEGRKTHPLYKKSYVSSKKYLADDPLGTKLGDIVEVVKIKPVSKRKHWQVKKVLGTDVVALGEEHMKEKAQEAIEEAVPALSVRQAGGRQVMPEEEKAEEQVKQEEPKKMEVKETKKTIKSEKVRTGRSANMTTKTEKVGKESPK